MGLGFPLHMALIGDVAEPARRPLVSSLSWFLMGACFFVVPILLGNLAELMGSTAAFQLLTTILVASSFWVHFLWNPRHSLVRRPH